MCWTSLFWELLQNKFIPVFFCPVKLAWNSNSLDNQKLVRNELASSTALWVKYSTHSWHSHWISCCASLVQFGTPTKGCCLIDQWSNGAAKWGVGSIITTSSNFMFVSMSFFSSTGSSCTGSMGLALLPNECFLNHCYEAVGQTLQSNDYTSCPALRSWKCTLKGFKWEPIGLT